jgi:hypothetical protein
MSDCRRGRGREPFDYDWRAARDTQYNVRGA